MLLTFSIFSAVLAEVSKKSIWCLLANSCPSSFSISLHKKIEKMKIFVFYLKNLLSKSILFPTKTIKTSCFVNFFVSSSHLAQLLNESRFVTS